MVPEQFLITDERPFLSGETEGEGPDVVLCHGLSASRRYVTHGSHALPRAGYRVHTYDARGHGESDPAPPGQGYGYEYLVSDLDRVIRDRSSSDHLVVGGHSMGCHTAAAWALANPSMVDALILIGPVHGHPPELFEEDRWDSRARALREGGPSAFAEEASRDISDEEQRETARRIALDRAGLHRDLGAVSRALEEVPRSAPFDDVSELGRLEAPCLVIGSHDEADPGHPLETARLWTDRIPDSRLVVEREGESPLAWQGGRLSRVIAGFLDEVFEGSEAVA